MKIYFQVCCLVLISLIVVTDSYADTYRVQGQFYLDSGQVNGKWTRGFASNVVSEVPIDLEVGGDVITLVFTIEPPPSINYSLTVSLKKNQKPGDESDSTFFTNTYQSTLVGGLNGPFEFADEQNGIKFGGAFGLAHRPTSNPFEVKD